ncbi:MAG TPA: hypothetical protein VE872_00255 [Candidatus Bathyarchaeia archaeon]|nr:hypothetical protein [Candidatus Bathyarchaeia archaeon]
MPSQLDCRTSPEPAPSGAEVSEPVFCLSLRSLPEIGIIARVVQQLARLQLLPQSWHVTGGGGHLLIDLQIVGLASQESELLAEAMRRIIGVEEVLTARTMRRTAA